MNKEDIFIYVLCKLQNIAHIICFTILAIVFQKWWIVLFAALFYSTVTWEEDDDDDF